MMKRKPAFNLKGALGTTAARLIMLVAALVVLYPLFWNLCASFKSNTEVIASPWSLPTTLQFENYLRAFEKANIGGYFFNSILVVVLATSLHLLLAIPLSYALSRFRFFGSRVITSLYMACIFIQEAYILVPLFLQLNKLGMLDNLLALSLIYAVVRLPFTTFLLSGFLKGIPADYEQAAMIDGCSYPRILAQIIVPLAKPGIFTAGLLAALGYWNEYAIALTLISSETKNTIPVGLINLYEVQRYATDWGALFAALIIVLVPSVLVYIFAQERLTQGMSVGGIKE